jgi:hypothetical protein
LAEAAVAFFFTAAVRGEKTGPLLQHVIPAQAGMTVLRLTHRKKAGG